jgi:anti-sigma factor ChrR (cupin superfamily)
MNKPEPAKSEPTEKPRLEAGGGRWLLAGLPNIEPSAFTFRPFRPGIERAEIYVDADTGASTALLRYASGATVPLHRHTAYEHIFVLSGSQSDDDGTYGPGSVLIHAPGTQHRVWTEAGCLVLAVWERPVEFL